MQKEKIATQMKKGMLEYLILSIIGRGNMYASDILQILKQHNFIVVEGTLYPLLSRLKETQLVTYTWVESPQGPPRKYYSLSTQGQETLEIMKITRKEITTIITNITQ